MTEPRILVALDYPDGESAMALVRRLEPGLCGLKVGKELFVAAGPDLVRDLVGRGFRVFLDLKFHDIPNTVAQACAAAARLGVWMINVHASGGLAMMRAAREAVDKADGSAKLIAVTVLTSMGRPDLTQIGLDMEPADQVLRLARLAAQAGLDGVVCSAREAGMLRAELGAGFLLVTPGIRPSASARGDQQRVLTPAQAMASGADYLVIGRPVTQAPDPIAALQHIHDEIDHFSRS